MPDKSKIILNILDDNSKQIFDAVLDTYAKPIEDVKSWGESLLSQGKDFISFGKDVVGTIYDAFRDSQIINNKTVITPSYIKTPSSYAESWLPESKIDGTLRYVTRYDIRKESDDSNLLKNMSFTLSNFTSKLTLKNKITNELFSIYAGERAGIGYEKREGFNNRFRKGIKADYNLFSNRVRLYGYYKTPSESIDGSLFYKNGNYGVTAGYSNSNGLSVKGAVDKYGGSVNIRHEKVHKDCYTSSGFYVGKDKEAGIEAGITFRVAL